MQLKSAKSLTQVFTAMVQASSLNTADAQKLTAFVQNSNEDGDEELGAPAAAVFENQSVGSNLVAFWRVCKPQYTMGQSALRSVRSHQEAKARSKHPDDSVMDRPTVVPPDVYAEFLAAGKAARRRS